MSLLFFMLSSLLFIAFIHVVFKRHILPFIQVCKQFRINNLDPIPLSHLFIKIFNYSFNFLQQRPFYIFLLAILFSCGWIYRIQMSTTILEIYILFLVFSIYYVLTQFISTKSIFELLYSLLLLSYCSFIPILSITMLASKGHLSFPVSVIYAALIVIPFVIAIKKIIISNLNFIHKDIASLVAFIAAEGYLLIVFGLYYLSIDQVTNHAKTDMTPWKLIFRIMYYGGHNLFQYPTIRPQDSLAPFGQYMIGFILNIIVVSFFISSLSNLFSKELSRKEGKFNAQQEADKQTGSIDCV